MRRPSSSYIQSCQFHSLKKIFFNEFGFLFCFVYFYHLPQNLLLLSLNCAKANLGGRQIVAQLGPLVVARGSLRCKIPSSFEFPTFCDGAIFQLFLLKHWDHFGLGEMAGFLTWKTLKGEGRECHCFFCLVFSTEKGSSDGSGGGCSCGPRPLGQFLAFVF